MSFQLTRLFLLFSLLISFCASGQSLYDPPPIPSKEQVGIYIRPGLNMNASSMKNVHGAGPAKGTMGLLFHIGAYYQNQIGKSTYFRGGLDIGYTDFSFKYARTVLPASDTIYPQYASDEESVHNYVPLVAPNIAIGKFFIIRKKHLLDISLGIAAPLYLTKQERYGDTITSKASLKGVGNTSYNTYYHLTYGKNEKQFLLDGTLYLGYRPIDFMGKPSRMGIGLQLNYSFHNTNSGYADILFENITYNYTEAKQLFRFSNTAISVRISYDIL